jgi:hypothetical protein
VRTMDAFCTTATFGKLLTGGKSSVGGGSGSFWGGGSGPDPLHLRLSTVSESVYTGCRPEYRYKLPEKFHRVFRDGLRKDPSRRPGPRELWRRMMGIFNGKEVDPQVRPSPANTFLSSCSTCHSLSVPVTGAWSECICQRPPSPVSLSGPSLTLPVA